MFRLRKGGFTPRRRDSNGCAWRAGPINPRRMQRYGRAPDVNRGNHLNAGATAGRRESPFTYFFYVPEHPNVVVVDLDKPLDKQT